MTDEEYEAEARKVDALLANRNNIIPADVRARVRAAMSYGWDRDFYFPRAAGANRETWFTLWRDARSGPVAVDARFGTWRPTLGVFAGPVCNCTGEGVSLPAGGVHRKACTARGEVELLRRVETAGVALGEHER